MKSAAYTCGTDPLGNHDPNCPAATPTRCACEKFCGDVPEADDRPNAVCKGLPYSHDPTDAHGR